MIASTTMRSKTIRQLTLSLLSSENFREQDQCYSLYAVCPAKLLVIENAV